MWPRAAFGRWAQGAAAVCVGAGLAACALAPPAAPGVMPPYPYSRYVTGISWDFSPLSTQRRAHGSDLWPCAWASDDNLYCAWGDGGGFDGDDDNIGRVSLGFARIEGTPSLADPSAWTGKNVWGEPPYAENKANFGGKVSSMTGVGGVLYGTASLWTAANSARPSHTSEAGPLKSLIWSSDLGKTWQIAPWSVRSGLGSFLNFGRDGADAFDSWIYLYYLREADTRHLYLKRVRSERLQSDPAIPGSYQYLSGVGRGGRRVRWSTRDSDAVPVFCDVNNVLSQDVVYDAPLRRYLLTVGHYATGDEHDASAGQFGVFESPFPWGPWSTIAYYEDWGGLRSASHGDFIEMHIPAKWIGDRGVTFWAVFSGLRAFDSFNLVRGTLSVAAPGPQ